MSEPPVVPPGFKDHFSSRSALYRRYRPRYPGELFDYLASLAPSRRLAWDCGTGSGQAAPGLASRFERVIASDASLRQLGRAEGVPGARYVAALAEVAPLPPASVDLVTVAQAAHWFSFERFYTEVGRVARPGGILALWTYPLLEIEPAIDTEIRSFARRTVGPWWPPERRYVDERYATLPFPRPEIEAPTFETTAEWTLDDLDGYLHTWSAVRRYQEARRHDPVPELVDRLRAVWGRTSRSRRVRWSLPLRVARIG